MYNTGQYDYQILQALQQILSTLQGFTTFFESIVNNWFPIAIACLAGLCIISLVKWLVKL